MEKLLVRPFWKKRKKLVQSRAYPFASRHPLIMSLTRITIFSLLAIVLLSACYPEWKLAQNYIKSSPDVSVMILPTNYVFKKNLKITNEKEFKNLPEWEKDSLSLAQSSFLKDISDSVFLERFINSMIVEFEAFGFKVYTEEYLDSFLFIQSPAYIFNIAQIELEEHYNIYKDEAEVDGYTYYKSVDLDAISYNFWFEISELNNDKKKTTLLFVDETITDRINGYFSENIFTGEVKYKYKRDEIDLDIIYRYCDIFGKRYAGYTFDFLMNNYIQENWSVSRNVKFYMQYQRENNTLDMTGENKFILLDE